jgi:hypothetical protein
MRPKQLGNQKRQTHQLVGFLLGGFIPNCCARHDVKTAKEEIVMTKEVKKVSLMELALSLGFTVVDESDPIYQEGWFIMSSVGQELERLENIEKNSAKREKRAQ